MNVEAIANALLVGDAATLAASGIVQVDGKWEFADKDLKKAVRDFAANQAEYFDMVQHVRKIALNSLYGATINSGSRYYRDVYGASTTGGGREITKHMIKTIGKELTGKDVNISITRNKRPDGSTEVVYITDNTSVTYGDTDSLVFCSEIVSDVYGDLTIEELFLKGDYVAHDNGKERAYFDSPVCSQNFNFTNDLHWSEIDHVYRHRVTKSGFKITLESGHSVVVTNDHSLMVVRDGILVETKPSDLLPDDEFICISPAVTTSWLKSIEPFEFVDEYVYDIVMKDTSTPYFFGDGILVHNSCYFSTGADNTQDAIIIADHIADVVNESFPGFLRDRFLVQESFSDKIKVGREVVADRGIFIAKKKYILHVVDSEGKKVDKLKSMGVEIKKSDTPGPIRKFLETIVVMVLKGRASKADVYSFVETERDKLFVESDELIKMGVIKAANNVEKILEQLLGGLKPVVPGHVRAAINYNDCLDMFKDYVSPRIYGGDKIKVFELEDNQFLFKTVALPVDMESFPPWFSEHFRLSKIRMEEKLIENKLSKLFAAIGWEVPTRREVTANKLLEF